MRFNPSDANAHLIPTGTWCEALIVEAVDTVSKGGNEMIVATFRVWGAGMTADLRHYFVASRPGMLKKMCAVLGITSQYEAGEIVAETLKGREMRALIKIQEDETGKWDDKNVVAAFEAKAPKDAQPKPDPANEFDQKTDDGIPFAFLLAILSLAQYAAFC